MKIKSLISFILIFLAVLSIVALIMSFWLGAVDSFRLVFGILYIFFIPGFIWSYVFFIKGKNINNEDDTSETKPVDSDNDEKIDFIERIILSIALSLALVPLFIFFLNKMGVAITLMSVIIEIFGIILTGAIILIAKYFLGQKVESRK